MNPNAAIISEFIEVRRDGSYRTIGDPIITFTWKSTGKNHEKTIAKAVNDSRERYDWNRIPNLDFSLFSFFDLPPQQEYYCKLGTIITGFNIDTFDIKNKNKGSKVNKREELKEAKEKQLVLQDEIKAEEENIEGKRESVRRSQFHFDFLQTELENITKKIQSLEKELSKPKIYRLKPLGDGRLYVELKGDFPKRKSGIISYLSFPYSIRVVGVGKGFFEKAYICQCGSKLGWTFDRNTELHIDIEEFIPCFQ